MTVRIQGDNTNGSPAITGDDTDSGIVIGTNEVDIVTNGTSKVNVDTDGNVEITSTGSLRVPVGTEAQRPGTGAAGMLRYNSDTNNLEYFRTDSNAFVPVTDTGPDTSIRYLVIAGGGGGGACFQGGCGGGGGAGGYRTNFGTGNVSGGQSAVEADMAMVLDTALDLTVGAGATAQTGNTNSTVAANNGSDSTFRTITSTGGGGGGRNDGGSGANGGSGGGAGVSPARRGGATGLADTTATTGLGEAPGHGGQRSQRSRPLACGGCGADRACGPHRGDRHQNHPSGVRRWWPAGSATADGAGGHRGQPGGLAPLQGRIPAPRLQPDHLDRRAEPGFAARSLATVGQPPVSRLLAVPLLGRGCCDGLDVGVPGCTAGDPAGSSLQAPAHQCLGSGCAVVPGPGHQR